jgi:hypothetical protein
VDRISDAIVQKCSHVERDEDYFFDFLGFPAKEFSKFFFNITRRKRIRFEQ